ncbi:MAG: hypothetical protein AAFX50_12905, partial [Acidobacteriota bacterium]
TFTESTVTGELAFASDAAADPGDPSRIVAAGWLVGVQESLDFGRTWTRVAPYDGETPNSLLTLDPRDRTTLWGGTFGQIRRSADGGQTWQTVEIDDSIADIAVHPGTGDVWLIGDSLWRSTDGGDSFQPTPGLIGTFFDLAVDTEDPRTLYLAREWAPGAPTLYRSTDGGDTWQDAEPSWPGGDIERLAQSPWAPEEWVLSATNGLYWRSDTADPGCVDDATPGLCLRRGRFEVRASWTDFTGRTGRARMVPFQTDESGVFTFFSPDNWELMVKVLDGCGFNGHRWVFAAGITNVDFEIQVADRQTGELRQYYNYLGENAPAITDTEAFRCSPSEGSNAANPPADSLPRLDTVGCGSEDDPALCLGPDGRFRVSARWRDFDDRRGPAAPVSFATDDSGLFTFFSPDNWELMVKVLDGCGFNDRIWIFGAGTTNVEFDLVVTDQETGATRTYRNPLGRPAAAIIDTSAFDACP